MPSAERLLFWPLAPRSTLEGMDPSTISPKSRLVAFLVGAPFGVFGAHRFYVGKTGSGIGMIFTLGGMGIWWLVDMILILSGEFRDADHRRVTRWMVDEEFLAAAAQAEQQKTPEQQRALEEMETMRAELFDLQERVDFMERTLAQVRQEQRKLS